MEKLSCTTERSRPHLSRSWKKPDVVYALLQDVPDDALTPKTYGQALRHPMRISGNVPRSWLSMVMCAIILMCHCRVMLIKLTHHGVRHKCNSSPPIHTLNQLVSLMYLSVLTEDQYPGMLCLWQAVPLHGCQSADTSSQRHQWSRSMWPAIMPFRKSPGSERCYMILTSNQLGPPSSTSTTLAHGLWLWTRSYICGPNILTSSFGSVRLEYVPTNLQVVDEFTKALTGEAVHRHQCVLVCEPV